MANKQLNRWIENRRKEIVEQVEEGKEFKGFTDLPVGLYIAVYVQNEIKESNEKMGLLTEWIVLEGEHTGESIYNWTNLEREDAFKWLTVSLKNAGIEIDDPEELVDEMAKNPEDFFGLVASQRVVKVRIKQTKGKDGNDYVNKQIEKALLEYEVDQEFIDKILADKKAKKAAKNSDSDEADEVEDEADEVEDEADEVEDEAESSEDEAEDESETSGDEIHIGSRVTFLQGRKTNSGVVKSTHEDEGTVVVTLPNGNDTEIGVDTIQQVDNSDSEKV